MNDISMSRSGRSKYTREDIFKALVKNQSLEFGYNNDLTYNIHLDDEGNILWGMERGSTDLVYELHYADYGLAEEEWDSVGTEWFYANETWDCEAFVEAVDGLTEQVNQYLKEIDECCEAEDRMLKKLWYAYMSDWEDNDWGTGTFDRAEAIDWMYEQDDEEAYIAVIDGNYDENGKETTDPLCVGVIKR